LDLRIDIRVYSNVTIIKKEDMLLKWTISEVSKQTGIPAETLRYYDKKGVISPKCGENRYRYYDHEDIIKLQYITVMKYAQFSLEEIKTMVERFGNESSAECNEIFRKLLSSKIKDLKNAVENYQKIIRLMDELMPMVDNMEHFCENQPQVEAFIKDIYGDIQRGEFLPKVERIETR